MKKSQRKLLVSVVFLCLVILVMFVRYRQQAQPLSEYESIGNSESSDPFYLGNVIGSGLEIPKQIDGHQVVEHTGYVLSYNEEYEVADWVAYEFTHEELLADVANRKDNFRSDPAIVTGSAELSDYKKSGYSRGHLAPAADFNWSEEAMSDTFYLSNMTPQLQNNFNAGIWLDAENYVRELCEQNNVVFVVTGPVLTDGPYETIGKNKVAVPKQFYKVLLCVDSEGYCFPVAMVIPHDAERKSELASFFCTINQVEEITGLDFFPMLNDSIEEVIESKLIYN